MLHYTKMPNYYHIHVYVIHIISYTMYIYHTIMIQTYTDLASHQTVPLLQNRTFNVWAMISHWCGCGLVCFPPCQAGVEVAHMNNNEQCHIESRRCMFVFDQLPLWFGLCLCWQSYFFCFVSIPCVTSATVVAAILMFWWHSGPPPPFLHMSRYDFTDSRYPTKRVRFASFEQ